METEKEASFSLFDTSWEQMGEVMLAALITYIAIIVVVRVQGARTTAQLNSFDWIINVMVGSLAASGVLLEDVSVIAAIGAIVLLAVLQSVLARVTGRFDMAAKAIKSRPILLTDRGRFLQDAMDKVRITKAELMSVLRSQGYMSVEDANWIILETNGSLSVIPRDDDIDAAQTPGLEGVRTPEE